MSRLNEANVQLAREIIGRYPQPRSATIPLLHLAQQQNGYITNESIAHIAELVGATAAEVLGTCTFYEMFKMKPVGKYLINVCGTMSCALMGAADVIHRAEQVLGIRVGDTTDDGLFTLEQAECQAACTEAPCLQVNYRYRYRVTPGQVEVLIDDLRNGRLDDEIPPHGTVAKVRQRIPADRAVGAVPPDEVTGAPAWMQGAAQ
ncbi:MAG: NADH-quinone oxidoreductase subunit NuoE [Ilumatobacteraceae bacterium]